MKLPIIEHPSTLLLLAITLCSWVPAAISCSEVGNGARGSKNTLQHITDTKCCLDEEVPFVTCSFTGQLGNQLFMAASTLAYAWDHNRIPLFPELNRTDMNIPINRAKIFFRLDTSPLPRPINYTFFPTCCFTYEEIPDMPDMELKGIYQSWHYFDHYRERILDLFAPSNEEVAYLTEKYQNILEHPFTVGIHIRTFDENWTRTTIPFLDMNYYIQAMNLFPIDALFVVFSDRIQWCKRNLPKMYRNVVFIEGQDHVDDFYLMSMMKHNIIGNSTYSWWAAYMNKNPNKIVVAPSHFVFQEIATHCKSAPNTNMPDWIVLPHNLKAPYPTDIRNYDHASQSIDTP